MIQIVEGVYLGNQEAARDRDRLRRAGVTHIVNCTVELPNYHEGEFTYLALGMRDPDPTFAEHIVRTCAFIDEARRQGKVLVHCFAAISRSPAVVLSYLCHLGLPLDEAARRLAALVWTDPDLLFLRLLADHLGLDCPSCELERISSLLLGRTAQEGG